MERLLRDELEKWDNDADMPGRASAPGSATVCLAPVSLHYRPIGLFIYLFIYYKIVHEVHDRQTYSKNNEISKSCTVTLSQYLATLSLEHVQQSFTDCDCNILFPICSKLSLFLSTAAITIMN